MTLPECQEIGEAHPPKPLEKTQGHVFSCPVAVIAAAKGKRGDVCSW